jgi:TPR repeat protein
MKKAAKILCIIALIFGLIWATVGFIGTWFGGAVVATVDEMSKNSQGANATMDKSVGIMLRLLGSFVVVIIGGVLGIVGSDKKNSLKPIILGILTFICGYLLFPLSNYVAAVLYLVAGLLLFLTGWTTKQVENIDEDKLGKKKLMLSIIGIGIALVVVAGSYFLLKDSSEKQTNISNYVAIEEQVTGSESTKSSQEMFELGEKYYFDKNYTEAEKYYRMSAEQGNADAQNKLGNMYFDGKVVAKDYSEAFKWYQKSAEQGNVDSQYMLGSMYHLGDGVTENLSEAVKWYRKSAEQGDASAQNSLGDMYFEGDGVTQNVSEALKWYRKSAEQGNKYAQYKLGNTYHFGQGGTVNYSEALKWYRKSAEQGNADAQYFIGMMYQYGDGVTKDYAKALEWYQKAAKNGDKRAAASLESWSAELGEFVED